MINFTHGNEYFTVFDLNKDFYSIEIEGSDKLKRHSSLKVAIRVELYTNGFENEQEIMSYVKSFRRNNWKRR